VHLDLGAPARGQQLGGVLDAAPWRGEDRVTGDRESPEQ
jgi:hypothetical protein